ncbi:MAG: hypothetical protein QG657_89 [Acidobacteriota bacterium]|nr:hypothetical protein [Acidobacteriota bacterium]
MEIECIKCRKNKEYYCKEAYRSSIQRVKQVSQCLKK